jgi:hypothetical protein
MSVTSEEPSARLTDVSEAIQAAAELRTFLAGKGLDVSGGQPAAGPG